MRIALARSSASKNSSSPGGQPFAQRPLHRQALVAAADPLEQHLGGDQQAVPHPAVQRLRAQVKRVLHPLLARRQRHQQVRIGRGLVADAAAEHQPEDRGQPLLPVEHEQRARQHRPGRLRRAAGGDLVGRADVPGARRERRLAFPLRLPQQQRPDRIRPVQRIVQRAHAVRRPDEPALQIGQVQAPVPFQRREAGDLPGSGFEVQRARGGCHRASLLPGAQS